MGCDRFREVNSLGFGGVRASMERRWLLNAKTTVMRQRKWEEARLQKEVHEQKKKADILEKRKRERAKLAAYIHSSVQPPVKCVTGEMAQRNNQKRLNWNACLLRDQELILKLRENVKAVAPDYHNLEECSNSDTAMQGSYTSRTAFRDLSLPKQVSVSSSRSVEHILSLKTDDRYSDQSLKVPTKCADAVFPNHLFKMGSHSAYQMLQLPGTGPVRCEIAINASAAWAPNMMPLEAKFADDNQKISMSGTCKSLHVNSDASQLGSSVPPNLEEAEPRVVTERIGCSESVETNAELASFEIATCGERDSAMKRPSCDLRKEILKSRLANEAATTRLIAEVTAIESRLEDCNLNLKSLGIREDPGEFFPDTGPTDILYPDVCSSHCGSFTKMDLEFLFNREIRHGNASRASGVVIKTDEQEIFSLGGKQPSQPAHETRVSLPPSENDLVFDTKIFGSIPSNRPAGIKYRTQGENGMKGSQAYEQAYTEIAGLSFANQVSSNNARKTDSPPKIFTNIGVAEEMRMRPEDSPSCCEHERREVFVISDALPVNKIDKSNRIAYSKSQKDCATVSGNSLDIVSMKASSIESIAENYAAWKIDWDAVTDVIPERNQEYLQSLQCGYFPVSSNMDGVAVGCNQGSHHSRLSPHVYESRQKVNQKKLPCFLNVGGGRQEGPPEQGGDDCHPSNVEGRRVPSNFETAGLVQNSPDLEAGHCLLDQYTYQDTNWARCAVAPSLFQNDINYLHLGRYVEDSSGDKENYCESQKKSIIEEEQKIFASLDRLDWKLAAISLRSRNVGRESTVSQGQYSMKSAPAVMQLPPRTVMEHFSVSGKKANPYSAIPPRPSTPQGGPTLRMPIGRPRRLVGLTNKGGRIHNLDRKNIVDHNRQFFQASQDAMLNMRQLGIQEEHFADLEGYPHYCNGI